MVAMAISISGTLTAGEGIDVTNADGSITIAEDATTTIKVLPLSQVQTLQFQVVQYQSLL